MLIRGLSPPAALAFPGGSFHSCAETSLFSVTITEQMCHNNFLVGGKSVVGLVRVEFLLKSLTQGLQDALWLNVEVIELIC